jgi:hypothetical protein
MLPNYFDMRSGEWTLQLNCNQLCWETSNTKNGQNGQKLPSTAKILQVYFCDCTGLLEVITFEYLTWFDSSILLWPYSTYISTYWISAPSCPQPELEQNRLRDVSFALRGSWTITRSEEQLLVGCLRFDRWPIVWNCLTKLFLATLPLQCTQFYILNSPHACPCPSRLIEKIIKK